MDLIFLVAGIIVIGFGVYINLKRPVSHAILPYTVGLLLLLIGSPLKERIVDIAVSLNGIHIKLSEPNLNANEKKHISNYSAQSFDYLYETLIRNQASSKEKPNLEDPNYFDYLKQRDFLPANVEDSDSFKNSLIYRPGNIIEIKNGKTILLANTARAFPGAKPEITMMPELDRMIFSINAFEFQCSGAREVNLRKPELQDNANSQLIRTFISAGFGKKVYVIESILECSSISIAKKDAIESSDSAKIFQYRKMEAVVIGFRIFELKLIK